MRLHILGVGQADALVLELPSNRLAVVDFGHELLLDYLDQLDRQRMRRFAFCLLTHPHHDHYKCLDKFIRRHHGRVDEYWFSFPTTQGIPQLVALQGAMAQSGRGRLFVQDRREARPFLLEPDLEVVPFAPSTQQLMGKPESGDSSCENNRSIVLLLRYGQATILLGADAEASRWDRIKAQAAAAGISLAADVVKAPHHGAAPPHGLPLGMWPTVLRSGKSIVAFSAGRGRDKPALQTIRALRRRAEIHCTGRAAVCPLISGSPRATMNLLQHDLISTALLPAPEEQVPIHFRPCERRAWIHHPQGGVG